MLYIKRSLGRFKRCIYKVFEIISDSGRRMSLLSLLRGEVKSNFHNASCFWQYLNLNSII